MKKLKGWRTHILATTLMVLPGVLTVFAGVDWQAIGIAPDRAAILGVIFNVLRVVSEGVSPLARAKKKDGDDDDDYSGAL